MGTGILIFAALAAVMLAIGAGGWMLVSRINRGKSADDVKVSQEKLDEWSKLAAEHDPVKAADERHESDCDAYRELKRIRDAAAAAAGAPLRVTVTCASLDEYREFNAARWIKENVDMDEAKDLAARLDGYASAWAGIMDDFERACVMACDETDAAAQGACWELADDIIAMFPDGLPVAYSYMDAAGAKCYRNVKTVPAALVRRIAGMGPDVRHDGPGIRERHEALKKAGYRCRLCGRSPLTGSVLKIWGDGNGGTECLCDNCRRI